MKVRRWLHCLCACLLGASAVQAHDSITADAASRYLQQVETLQTAALAAAAPAQRSAAWLSLGQMIEEIVDLLNRDVAAHGDVQGLPSRLLVSELPRRGVVLERTPGTGRFVMPLKYYEEAMRIAPDRRDPEAAYRLLRARFHESFDADPFQSRLDAAGIDAQVMLGEGLLGTAHRETEEIEFIVVVHRMQRARLERGPRGSHFSTLARQSAEAFVSRHPDSLRSDAVRAMMKSIPAR